MDAQVVTRSHPTPDPEPKSPGAAIHASCLVMRVTYRPQAPQSQPEQVHRDIKLLIPGDETALHLTHATADGQRRMTFVDGHHVSIVPAGRPHAFYCQSQSDLTVIGLDRAFFAHKTVEALGRAPVRLVERYDAHDPFLLETGRMLAGEFRRRRIPGATHLEFLAAVIAIHLAKNYGGERGAQDHVWLSQHKLSLALAFIRQHIAEELKVEQVAAAVDMSPFHFSRVFKRATGRSPHLYITTQRVERAKALLTGTDLALAKVAETVGFQTQSHFTNVFRKFTGLTPQVFRLDSQDLDAFPACG